MSKLHKEKLRNDASKGWAQWNRRNAVTGLYGNSVREEMEHDGHGINVVGGVG